MRRFLAVATLAGATLLSAGTAAAAPPGQGGAFNFRFGGFFPTGNGDFWSTNENKFTLDHSDLDGIMGGVGYSSAINNYLDFDVNADFYAAASTSANRWITDSSGFPILHDTRLAIFPLTVGLRVMPGGRYARRGAEGKHYVRRPVPYLGAGIGGAYWQYEEEGDFVYNDPSVPEGQSIYYDRNRDTGFAFEYYAAVGIEFPVAPTWNITFEARRSWADATVSGFFPSLQSNPPLPGSGNTLDLGGYSVFIGGSLRF
jgi:opacity protein-like surface antigen